MMYLKDVATVLLAQELCIGCGFCEQVCPHGVFEMTNGKAFISDKDLCMECGACATNCPAEAISVTSGVGCAQAIVNRALGRDGCDNCC